MKSENKGYRLMLGNILSQTVFYLILDYVYRSTPTLSVDQAVFWGYLWTLSLATPFYLAKRKSRTALKIEWKKYKKLIIFLAFLATVANLFWLWGMQQIGSGPLALMENSQIIFALVLGVIFLSEKLNLQEGLSALVILAGVVIISGLKGEVTLLGALAVIISALGYATHSFFVKKFGAGIHAFSFTYLRGWGMFTIITLWLIFAQKITLIPLSAMLLLCGAHIFGLFLSRFTYFEAHKFLSISKLNLFTLLLPVFVLMSTFVIFHDPISMQKMVGAGVIFGGMIFFTLERNKQTNT